MIISVYQQNDINNIQLTSEQKNILLIPQNIVDNSLHGEMSQVIKNFNNMNTEEIETLMSPDNNFDVMVKELIFLLENFEIVSKKHKTVNYLNDHNITSQEIYRWLLNNQNNSNSVFLLGVFNQLGIEVNVDEQKAFELYQNAANSGNVQGIISLGYCYIEGFGTSVNKQKGFVLYKKAANLGNMRGIRNLGYCYSRGIGTSVNKQKAFELYQKAANLGNVLGINNLGCCYNLGIGTSIDKQKAFELYQKAADLGDNLAQYNLALMYENGNGIKKDIKQAIYWYEKSSEQGDENAKNKLKNLKKRKWKLFT
jgi:TPR repeat protein